LRIHIKVRQAEPNVRGLLKRLRLSYSSGIVNGLMLVLWLHFLDSDSREGKPWLFDAFMLFFWAVMAFYNWRSHRKECDELEELLVQLESNQGKPQTP